MDLRSIRYFVSAVEHGSITAAAEACCVAQPSITHAIHQLEQEFETQLLVRSRKGVACTQAGEVFFQKVKGLLSHAQMIRQSMESPRATPQKLFVCPSIHATTLKECMAILKQRFPDQIWQLISSEREADYLIVSRTSDESHNPGFNVRPDESDYLFSEDYMLLVSSEHPLLQRLEHQNKLILKDLLEFPLIERTHCLFKSGFYEVLQQARVFEDVYFSASVDNDDRALSLVAANYGITFAPYTPLASNGLAHNQNIAAIDLAKIEGADARKRALYLVKQT